MIRHTFVRSTFLFLTTLAFAACDDDGTGPGDIGDGNGDDQIGEFTASISGDVSESATGGTFFSVDESGSWGIFLGGEETDDSAVWLFGEGGRPGTGTHTFDVDTDLGAFYVHGATGTAYFADAGTVTVTQSSTTRVTGSFQFTASDIEGGTVTVSGSFNAPNLAE